jgi:ketosteroid isomerase-like protein
VDGAVVLARLEQAMNGHDLELLAACFDEQVVSEQPAHPSRSFRGRAQIEKNWSQLFTALPDFAATLVRSAVDGSVVWAEWDWRAHRLDGGKAEMRGVTVLGVEGDRIGWVRFYVEPVEQDGAGIDAAIHEHVGQS